MQLKDLVNSEESALAEDILAMIKDESDPETAHRLTERYVTPSDGTKRIKGGVYYRVRRIRANRNGTNLDEVYLERDCLKSPRDIPENWRNFDLVNASGDVSKGCKPQKEPTSFEGGFILRWAFWQNSASSNPYFIDGCDIVSRYGVGENALRRNIYYFLSHNEHGVSVRRDLARSPRRERPACCARSTSTRPTSSPTASRSSTTAGSSPRARPVSSSRRSARAPSTYDCGTPGSGRTPVACSPRCWGRA